MARNICQVLGEDPTDPSGYSKVVVCWTPKGGIIGGTGQALRIAKRYDIPVLNLHGIEDRTMHPVRYATDLFAEHCDQGATVAPAGVKTTNCNIKLDRSYTRYCGRSRNKAPADCEVGETGWLGNPIYKGKPCPVCGQIHRAGGTTLPCYEVWLRCRLADDVKFRAEFMKLRGEKLGCYCKPAPCHTDIMIKVLDEG